MSNDHAERYLSAAPLGNKLLGFKRKPASVLTAHFISFILFQAPSSSQKRPKKVTIFGQQEYRDPFLLQVSARNAWVG